MKCKNCKYFKRFKQDGKDNFGNCDYLNIATCLKDLKTGGILIIGDKKCTVIFEENFGCDMKEPYKEVARV